MLNNFYHLKETNLTYIDHFKGALYVMKIFAEGFIKVFIHAIYPDVFTTTLRDSHNKISYIINNSQLK